MHRIAVVMAGGSGERFWPVSRASRPKQLLRLTRPDMNMLEEAVERIGQVVGVENVFIATSTALLEPVMEANVVPQAKVFAEPDRRNTLGALVWATANLMALFPTEWTEMSVSVVTADHKIGEPERFWSTVSAALDIAEQTGGLVTIGISPARPETGFGYIEVDRSKPIYVAGFRASSFREKPGPKVAAEYVESGRFLWNSGMFFWTLRAFHDALAAALPEAAETMLEIVQALTAHDAHGALASFRKLPNLSIDYALMEKAEQVYVVEGSFPWDDVGSWDALERTLTLNPDGNVVSGSVIALETTGSVLLNDSDGITTCVLGMEDVVVVTTKDAVLVCPKSRAQDVRKLVNELKARGSHTL